MRITMFYQAPYFGMPQLIRTAEGQDPLAEVVSRLCEAAEPGLADWAAGLRNRVPRQTPSAPSSAIVRFWLKRSPRSQAFSAN